MATTCRLSRSLKYGVGYTPASSSFLYWFENYLFTFSDHSLEIGYGFTFPQKSQQWRRAPNNFSMLSWLNSEPFSSLTIASNYERTIVWCLLSVAKILLTRILRKTFHSAFGISIKKLVSYRENSFRALAILLYSRMDRSPYLFANFDSIFSS